MKKRKGRLMWACRDIGGTVLMFREKPTHNARLDMWTKGRLDADDPLVIRLTTFGLKRGEGPVRVCVTIKRERSKR